LLKNRTELECQRQTGIEFSGFDRINRLPRHANAVSELRLSEALCLTMFFDSIFHT